MSNRNFANRVAATYAIVGTLWILVGSRSADMFYGADVAAHSSFELLKGLIFIAVTVGVLRWHLLGELRHRSDADAARARATDRLVVLLDQVVAALSHTLGQRDPYTAGHQERVAALAVAIARRMGLEEERVASIRTGALLHDIGKIGIPAELLSKPGRLTVDEFNLVKGHVRMGEAIVSKIDFDAVVHSVVAHHHERLDGSGYPYGLRGDQISVEARVVAVADVVEAMTSHRPYRVALGSAAARAEICALRGSKLDARAVDACLAIMEGDLQAMWTPASGSADR